MLPLYVAYWYINVLNIITTQYIYALILFQDWKTAHNVQRTKGVVYMGPAAPFYPRPRSRLIWPGGWLKVNSWREKNVAIWIYISVKQLLACLKLVCIPAVREFGQQGRHCAASSGSGGASAKWEAGFNFKPKQSEGRASGLWDNVKTS